MARSSSDSVRSGEDEEEALSLCDLPVNVTKDDDEEEEEPLLAESSNQQEEFEFGRGGLCSPSVRSEMCAAEDVFYRGQMLPLGHSFDSSYEKVKNIVNRGANSYPAVNKIPSCFIQSMSRSESMDRVLQSGFNSFSSRSSSSSSRSMSKTSSFSSGNTGSNIATTKPKEVNQFQISHPSPKPQMMRHSNLGGTQFSRSRNKSSSMWDFFKLGLVRTPELQDLNKVRTGCGSVSRNSSSGSSNSAGGKQSGFLERRGGAMLSGCSCTLSAVVKPIPLNQTTVNRDEDMEKVTSAAQRKNSKQRKKAKKKETTTSTTVEKLKGKQEMSRHRTFEWINELSQSHARYIIENNNNIREEETVVN